MTELKLLKKLQFKDGSCSFKIYEPKIIDDYPVKTAYFPVRRIKKIDAIKNNVKKIKFIVIAHADSVEHEEFNKFIETRAVFWIEEKIKNGNFEKNCYLYISNEGWGEKEDDANDSKYPEKEDRITKILERPNEFAKKKEDVDERLFETFENE